MKYETKRLQVLVAMNDVATSGKDAVEVLGHGAGGLKFDDAFLLESGSVYSDQQDTTIVYNVQCRKEDDAVVLVDGTGTRHKNWL